MTSIVSAIGVNLGHPFRKSRLAIIFHIQTGWCIVFINPVTIVQEPTRYHINEGKDITRKRIKAKSHTASRQGAYRVLLSSRIVYLPNASHILPYFISIGALKLAQLGVAFDFEENFVSR